MYEVPPSLRLVECVQFGTNTQHGNIVGVQAWMHASDYASPDSFQTKLAEYMVAGLRLGWLKENTVVVFPEHIGTWLVATNENGRVTGSGTLRSAMRFMVLSHPLAMLSSLPRARGKDRLVDSLFRMKAQEMAEVYHQTFSDLAKRFQVTVIAGSIVLPSPRIRRERIEIGRGSLENVSVIYRPDGAPYANLVAKIHPTAQELSFIRGGDPDDLRCYQTAAGRLGVLICADSWYPDAFESLRRQGCDILAVPSHLTPAGAWEQRWRGYSPGPDLSDVCAGDVGVISEGEAWLKYALAGRISTSGASSGMQVFFRGTVWDLGSDGQTVVVQGGRVDEAQRTDGAAIVNLWL